MNHLFIFGLGYSARFIAALALQSGFQVSGTSSRSMEGVTLHPFNAAADAALADATHILSSVPTQEGAVDPVLERYGAALKGKAWLGYLSTTGVYGDHQGAWVDEETPPQPDNDRLKRRVTAEQAWRAQGGHIFRLAGIYGPGRNALEDVRAGTARRIHKPGQVFSRIHAEDIAQGVLASMQRPNPGRIYNVCDDEAAPASDVVAYAAQLLKQEPPPLIPYEQAQLSPMGREFYASCRRVRNERIKEELGVKWRYPTYREGLAALAQGLH